MIGRRALLALPLLAPAAATAAPLAAPPTIPLAARPISRLDLRWWRERHEAKLLEARRGLVELVFLGDSITQQYEDDGPEPFRRFRPVWQQFYGDRRALNLGFSGDATSHLLWRIGHGEIDAVRPKAAVILIGANNLGRLHWPGPDTVAGIAAVVGETRRKLPGARILLLGVLPSERSAWASETTLAINRGLATRFARPATDGVTYQDVGDLFRTGPALDRGLFFDPLLTPPAAPLHPTAAGQARMAAAIEPTLARLLGDRDHSRP